MTQMPPVYDEVRRYLDQIRSYLDAIDRSLQRLPAGKDADAEHPPYPR